MCLLNQLFYLLAGQIKKEEDVVETNCLDYLLKVEANLEPVEKSAKFNLIEP